MKKSTKFFCFVGLISIFLGLILCGISFIAGANFEEYTDIFAKSKILSYFYRNNNQDLSKDALIWENAENSQDNFFIIMPNEKNDYPLTSIVIENINSKILFTLGDSLKIKVSNLQENAITCKLSKKGLLTVKDSTSFGIFNIFSRHNYSENGTIEIVLPENIYLEKLSVNVKYGYFGNLENHINCDELLINNHLGETFIYNISSQKSEIINDYGKIDILGDLYNDSKIFCNSGKIELALNNNFSYTVDNGMGSVIINGLSLSNYNKRTFSEKALNNLDIQCKLGSVIIENK